MNLKQTARRLKKNKKNTKWLIVELMRISSIDFDIEHATYKLYKYGFGTIKEREAFKWMMELCDEQVLIFNGYKPEYVDDLKVGYAPVFGLIKE